MDKVEKFIRSFMFNYYVDTGKKIRFQSLQDFMAERLGFRYYVNEEGKKKLYIRKKIYPFYRKVYNRLEKMKKERDVIIRTLEMYMEMVHKGEIGIGFVREYFNLYRDRLTNKDESYWKKVLYQRKNEKVVL